MKASQAKKTAPLPPGFPSPPSHAQHHEPTYSANNQQSYNQAQEESYEKADASYAFAYSDESGNRKEESDADGNVDGQYSYVNAEGNEILVRYMAGPEIGFVIVNEEELTKSLEKATTDGAAAVFFKASQAKASAPVAAVHAASAPQIHPAPVAPVAPVAHSASNQEPVYATQQSYNQIEEEEIFEKGDNSYAFTYSDESGNRKEESDADGNVHGEYSYINAEGNEILVKYMAGPDIGFVIVNEEQLTRSVQKATSDAAATAAVKAASVAPAAPAAPVPGVAAPQRRRKVVKKVVKKVKKADEEK